MKKYTLLALAAVFALATSFGFIAKQQASAESNVLIISAVQIGTLEGSGYDYVEIFNPSASAVSLAGMRLVKRSETGTSDASLKSWSESSEEVVPAHSFYLWANSGYTSIARTPDAVTSGTLSSNNGVGLRKGSLDSGELIASLSWGSANNGFASSSLENPELGKAIVVKDPYNLAGGYEAKSHNPRNTGVELMPDGEQNTSNTCGETANTPTETDDEEDTVTVGSQTGLKISEIYPNPAEGEEEYLELVNTTSGVVQLSGAVIQVGTRKQVLDASDLAAGGLVLLKGNNLKVPLANSGKTIELYSSAGNLLDSIAYPELAKGVSYSLIDGEFKQTQTPTPGVVNVLSAEATDNEGGTEPDGSASESGATGAEQDDENEEVDQGVIQGVIDSIFGESGEVDPETGQPKRKVNIANAVAFGLAVVGAGTYAMYKFGLASYLSL